MKFLIIVICFVCNPCDNFGTVEFLGHLTLLSMISNFFNYLYKNPEKMWNLKSFLTSKMNSVLRFRWWRIKFIVIAVNRLDLILLQPHECVMNPNWIKLANWLKALTFHHIANLIFTECKKSCCYNHVWKLHLEHSAWFYMFNQSITLYRILQKRYLASLNQKSAENNNQSKTKSLDLNRLVLLEV